MVTNNKFFQINSIPFVHENIESMFVLNPDSELNTIFNKVKGDAKLIKILHTNDYTFNCINYIRYNAQLKGLKEIYGDFSDCISKVFPLKEIAFINKDDQFLFINNEDKYSLDVLNEYRNNDIDFESLIDSDCILDEGIEVFTGNKKYPIMTMGSRYGDFTSIFLFIFDGDVIEMTEIDSPYELKLPEDWDE